MAIKVAWESLILSRDLLRGIHGRPKVFIEMIPRSKRFHVYWERPRQRKPFAVIRMHCLRTPGAFLQRDFLKVEELKSITENL